MSNQIINQNDIKNSTIIDTNSTNTTQISDDINVNELKKVTDENLIEKITDEIQLDENTEIKNDNIKPKSNLNSNQK